MKLPLAQKNQLPLLIARPHERGQALKTALELAGFAVQSLEIIKLFPRSIDTKLWTRERFDWLIFTSPMAVECFAKQFGSEIDAFEQSQIVCIGPATQHAVETWCKRKARCVFGENTSESLLACDFLQDLKNQRLLLVHGASHRDVLAETLQARQAQLHQCEIYFTQRLPLSETLKTCLQSGNYLALILTSALQLEHLNKSCIQASYEKPLLVSSQRLQQLAQKLGFQHVYQAQNATIKALVSQCKALFD